MSFKWHGRKRRFQPQHLVSYWKNKLFNRFYISPEIMKDTDEKTVYFAGELFSCKHLIGNAALANSIFKCSKGAFRAVLPQNLEQREYSARAIRDQDIKAVVSSDLALFNFDGGEIDSGTLVEFMIAKFCDIPSVILRTDFRRGGDGDDPWNLMISHYPRTVVVKFDAMALYQKSLATLEDNTKSESWLQAGVDSVDAIAEEIVSAFNTVIAIPSLLPAELKKHVYEWVRLMPGESFTSELSAEELLSILQRKKDCKLL